MPTPTRCDYCGFRPSLADPLQAWDWPGHRDGIWLHARCEWPWWVSHDPGF
jgi:hypothetical protein